MDDTGLRVGDIIFGLDIRNGAQRTGRIVEVVPDNPDDRPRYVVENRKGQRWTVFWPAT